MPILTISSFPSEGGEGSADMGDVEGGRIEPTDVEFVREQGWIQDSFACSISANFTALV